jgi:hypothetical protein
MRVLPSFKKDHLYLKLAFIKTLFCVRFVAAFKTKFDMINCSFSQKLFIYFYCIAILYEERPKRIKIVIESGGEKPSLDVFSRTIEPLFMVAGIGLDVAGILNHRL